MAAPDAVRFRVSVGPGSPLHAALMALPVDARATALLRWAEAGVDAQGAGPTPRGTPPSGPPFVDASALVPAVLRLSAAVERLAASREAPPADGGQGGGGAAEERAAGLDAAWG